MPQVNMSDLKKGRSVEGIARIGFRQVDIMGYQANKVYKVIIDGCHASDRDPSQAFNLALTKCKAKHAIAR